MISPHLSLALCLGRWVCARRARRSTRPRAISTAQTGTCRTRTREVRPSARPRPFLGPRWPFHEPSTHLPLTCHSPATHLPLASPIRRAPQLHPSSESPPSTPNCLPHQARSSTGISPTRPSPARAPRPSRGAPSSDRTAHIPLTGSEHMHMSSSACTCTCTCHVHVHMYMSHVT